jgi:hypothetical protein
MKASLSILVLLVVVGGAGCSDEGEQQVNSASAAGNGAAAGMAAPGSGAGASGAAATSGAGGGAGRGNGSNPNAVNPWPGFVSDIYAQDSMWMCKPGLATNYCIQEIADATEALPDGTFQPFMDDLRTDHPVDCIFWYPTVNRTEEPTSLDFSDPAPMLSSIRSQAARFSRVCNVYAPFYRQTSLNRGGDRVLAYSDVVASFQHYIANWSEGRNFVIYGHSQGTGHATRLITEHVNDNPDLRSRLISALLIGGRLSATTFSNIPLCTSPDQTGCAVAYQAYGATQALDSITAGLACTNPGALGGGPAIMKGSFFKSRGTNYSMDLGPEFTATWGLFRNFFSAECVAAPSGAQVLRIDYTNMPGDVRRQFLDLTRVIGFGLHVFDYQFPLDDLVELVRTQATAKLAAP